MFEVDGGWVYCMESGLLESMGSQLDRMTFGFRVAIIEDFKATVQTLPAPTCVTLGITVGAEFYFVGVTVSCLVLITAGPTCI